jgi:hypothetical protein
MFTAFAHMCRSAAGVDVVPTFTTSNARMCLLLSNGRFGLLRIEDAERLQVGAGSLVFLADLLSRWVGVAMLLCCLFCSRWCLAGRPQ